MLLTGAHASPPDPSDALLDETHPAYAGAPVPPNSDAVDLREIHTWREQRLQDCCSLTLAQQAQDLGTIRGHQLALIGPRFTYEEAITLRQAPEENRPLKDTGSNYRYNLVSARDRGLTRDAIWPEPGDAAGVAVPFGMLPPLHVRQAAKQNLLPGGFARVEHGQGQVTKNRLIRTLKLAAAGLLALPSARYPIYENFQFGGSRYDPYKKMEGRLLGWHMSQFSGYDPDRRAFLLFSTWERQWGDRGVFYVDEDLFLAFSTEYWTFFETPLVIL